MEDREYLEDCTGHRWERNHIPAEHDVWQKMNPVWKRLYRGSGYDKGKLLYEGYTVDNMAYGAGTSYYPSGSRCQEGLFGPNGLICGREYYINGKLRFEGTYQYNADYSENWPVFGAFYSPEGELKYYGAFDVIGTSDKVIRPLVMEPEGFGPVTSLMPIKGYLFRGEKTWKYYQISPEFKEQVYKAEKEKLRKIYSEIKKLKLLRGKLQNSCPEYREFAAEEMMRMGTWSEEDQDAIEKTRKRCIPPRTRLSSEERCKRDMEVLDISASALQNELKKVSGKTEQERDAVLREFADCSESIYPYRWGKDPRHKLIGVLLEERGINLDNWLKRLDEMTDREISYMLDHEIGMGRRNEERVIHPETSERGYAEFMRDFGL